eukprot:CAMPEP_0114507820 /NCGR_PEP_ID=MMETSP0109-20121206/12233_1 /TAXON_ID=29199 /ORGANISM="Chlorarachnion reptans, Strain CCCM449" /LENGTH=134 /DNA_ID=CAMNT_0001686637 /DNA_START=17 /DNA_END=421 /DNA_ORIENTATION=-
MVKPLVKHNIVKKRKKKFIRHQSDQFMRIARSSWRRPKGIDSRVRRRFKGQIKLANIGYGTDKKYRHVLPCGFLKFRVSNIKELEVLLMHNRKYAAEIAHNVSLKKRKEIVLRAAQLNIKVLNAKAKLTTQENE